MNTLQKRFPDHSMKHIIQHQNTKHEKRKWNLQTMLIGAIKGGVIYEVVFEGMLNKWWQGWQLRNVNLP